MPNGWDESYNRWLDARAAYLDALISFRNKPEEAEFLLVQERYHRTSQDFYTQIENVLLRAAQKTLLSFPQLANQIQAGDLVTHFKIALQKNPPKWVSEALIRQALRHRAIDLKKEKERKPTNQPDLDTEAKEPPAPQPVVDWPWFEMLPEPARGYGALFSHILRFDDISQADCFSKTGWFSGRSGESVRARLRNQADQAKERASHDNDLAGRTLRQSPKISDADLQLLNAEMLGAHSALTVSIRALCGEENTAASPFSAEALQVMSQITRKAPEADVALWVFGCLAGQSPEVPDRLAECSQRVFQGGACERDTQYFLGCVSLYLRAYSSLILPSQRNHWTEISAPMTPQPAAFSNYRKRAKSYRCLEKYLPTVAERTHADN